MSYCKYCCKHEETSEILSYCDGCGEKSLQAAKVDGVYVPKGWHYLTTTGRAPTVIYACSLKCKKLLLWKHRNV